MIDFITMHTSFSAIIPDPSYWQYGILGGEVLTFIIFMNYNFEWNILQAIVRQFDSLLIVFCACFSFAVDCNDQIKLLSLLWIVVLDCITRKHRSFMIYILCTTWIYLLFELGYQLVRSDIKMTDYLITMPCIDAFEFNFRDALAYSEHGSTNTSYYIFYNKISTHFVGLHSVECATLILLVIYLWIPLWKLITIPHIMRKKLLFGRRNRNRRDALKYATMMQRKEKRSFHEIPHDIELNNLGKHTNKKTRKRRGRGKGNGKGRGRYDSGTATLTTYDETATYDTATIPVNYFDQHNNNNGARISIDMYGNPNYDHDTLNVDIGTNNHTFNSNMANVGSDNNAMFLNIGSQDNSRMRLGSSSNNYTDQDDGNININNYNISKTQTVRTMSHSGTPGGGVGIDEYITAMGYDNDARIIKTNLGGASPQAYYFSAKKRNNRYKNSMSSIRLSPKKGAVNATFFQGNQGNQGNNNGYAGYGPAPGVGGGAGYSGYSGYKQYTNRNIVTNLDIATSGLSSREESMSPGPQDVIRVASFNNNNSGSIRNRIKNKNKKNKNKTKNKNKKNKKSDNIVQLEMAWTPTGQESNNNNNNDNNSNNNKKKRKKNKERNSSTRMTNKSIVFDIGGDEHNNTYNTPLVMDGVDNDDDLELDLSSLTPKHHRIDLNQNKSSKVQITPPLADDDNNNNSNKNKKNKNKNGNNDKNLQNNKNNKNNKRKKNKRKNKLNKQSFHTSGTDTTRASIASQLRMSTMSTLQHTASNVSRSRFSNLAQKQDYMEGLWTDSDDDDEELIELDDDGDDNDDTSELSGITRESTDSDIDDLASSVSGNLMSTRNIMNHNFNNVHNVNNMNNLNNIDQVVNLRDMHDMIHNVRVMSSGDETSELTSMNEDSSYLNRFRSTSKTLTATILPDSARPSTTTTGTMPLPDSARTSVIFSSEPSDIDAMTNYPVSTKYSSSANSNSNSNSNSNGNGHNSQYRKQSKGNGNGYNYNYSNNNNRKISGDTNYTNNFQSTSYVIAINDEKDKSSNLNGNSNGNGNHKNRNHGNGSNMSNNNNNNMQYEPPQIPFKDDSVDVANGNGNGNGNGNSNSGSTINDNEKNGNGNENSNVGNND